MVEMVVVYGINITAPVTAPPQTARAYSATIVRWLCTWGVAPGFILLRFQRALDTRGRTGHHGHCSLPSPMAMEGVFAARVGHTGAHGASWALSLVVSYGLRGRFFGACCSHEGTYGNHWKYGSRHLCAGNYHQRTGSAFYLLTLLLFTFQNCLFAFLPCSPSKSRAFLRFCGLFSVLLQWCRGTQRT